MKAVLAQLDPVPGGISANVATVESTVAEHAHADLVVFPELFLGGYDMETVADLAVGLDGPEVGRLCAAARSASSSIVVGLAEVTAGPPFNTSLLIDAGGRIAGIYRKTHLFGGERDAFTAGSELEPVWLGERRIGLMICFDVEFPEVARSLVARGASMLVTISANMAPFGPDHDLAARARALENGVPHLYANRVGVEAGLVFVGESQAVSPGGRTTSAAGNESCLLEVVVGESGAVDGRLNYATQLRPELYQLGEATSRPR